MKTCCTCKIEKSFESFSKCSKHADGLAYKCKPCAASYHARYKQNNRRKLNDKRNQTLKDQREGTYNREEIKLNIKLEQDKARQYCFDNRFTLTKTCNKCLEVKALSEFDRGLKEKDGFQYSCILCNREWASSYRKDNFEKEKERHRKYDLANPECVLKRRKTYLARHKDKLILVRSERYLLNREKELVRCKIWRDKNPEWTKNYTQIYRGINRDKIKEYERRYFKKNKARVYAKTARRRASLKNAYVSWADDKKIQAIYAECVRLTKETGVIHHVDHIVPLQSKYVCGLHNEHNLQILTARENLTKLNKFNID